MYQTYNKLILAFHLFLVGFSFTGCKSELSSNKKNYNFSNAVVVVSSGLSETANTAITVFTEELYKRTGIELPVQYTVPKDKRSVIFFGTIAESKETVKDINLAVPGEEGFQIWSELGGRNFCYVLGKDERGLLYGAGKLLRSIHFSNNKIWLEENIRISETPKYQVRGHQLGYRALNNTYDSWSIDQYDQYIRELALFGANSVELIAHNISNKKQNELMKEGPIDMIVANSKSCVKYGLDIWIWAPVAIKDLQNKSLMENRLLDRRKLFERMPRLDHVFVPGAEHYALPLNEHFIYLEKLSFYLKEHHPHAKVWISLQNSHASKEWLDNYIVKLNEKPDWLGGVVFSPWTAMSLPELRNRLDTTIPIRRYPDIAHNRNCEYPIPGWDPAFELTCAREATNPRPLAIKQIHNALDEYAIGGIGYSDGINDDVNKFIWLAQDWNPETTIEATLDEYSRFFINDKFSKQISEGLIAEEKNWQGALATNNQVPETLNHWQKLEQQVSPEILSNYRFQMGLIRAYYDAYQQKRLVYETGIQKEAEEMLAKAKNIGADKAIKNAEDIFKKALSQPVALDLKLKCLDLADSLKRSIGAQLSVEKHGASKINRGAYISGINTPLNDVFWYTWNFSNIKNDKNKLDAINSLINRTNPGDGGIYVNFGEAGTWSNIVPEELWATDPGTYTIPRMNFGIGLPNREVEWEGFKGQGYPLAWYTLATGLFDQPLEMTFDKLDKSIHYKLRLTYSGQFKSKIKLIANDKTLIHKEIETGIEPVLEYDLPHHLTKDGIIKLQWKSPKGERGAQVAEIFFIPQKK